MNELLCFYTNFVRDIGGDKMKSAIQIMVGVIVVATLAILLFQNMPYLYNDIQEFIPENLVSTYKINSVCELGTTPQEIMMEKLFPVMFELASGIHNDNENLINYVKTLAIPSIPNPTPELLFPEIEPIREGQVLGNRYDTAHMDMYAMMPFILVVMDASPEVREIFTYDPQKETHTSYDMRIQAEISKCS